MKVQPFNANIDADGVLELRRFVAAPAHPGRAHGPVLSVSDGRRADAARVGIAEQETGLLINMDRL